MHFHVSTLALPYWSQWPLNVSPLKGFTLKDTYPHIFNGDACFHMSASLFSLTAGECWVIVPDMVPHAWKAAVGRQESLQGCASRNPSKDMLLSTTPGPIQCLTQNTAWTASQPAVPLTLLCPAESGLSDSISAFIQAMVVLLKWLQLLPVTNCFSSTNVKL